MFFNRLFFFILLFISTCPSFYSQAVPVRIQGDVSDDKGNISGATVLVTQGGKTVNNITTDGGGKYSFELPLGGDYLVTVSKEGYVSKKFSINTGGVPPEKAAIKFPIIQASLGLFKKMEGVDYSLLNQPLNKYNYNPAEDNFEYDTQYLEQMIAKLGAIKEAEKELVKKEKEKEANYGAAIKQGDKAFGGKDWQTALTNYQEAIRLKPGEAYPAAQIAAVNKQIADLAAKKAADEAAAKAKADADALAKKQAEEAAAKKAADEAAAKKAAEEAAAAKAKAEKEAADKLAKEKADADAKAKAEADALAKKKADEAAAKKAADEAAAKAKEKADADAKAKAEADALAKKQADEAAAKKAADEAAAKKAAEDAAAKAKADKEAADKLAKEKAEADAKAKADALAKKAADEAAAKLAAADAAAKAKADKEAADKLAKEKAEADALAKKKADEEAAARAKGDKEAADKLAKEKAEADAKAKADALAKKAADEAAAKLATADAAAKAKADKDAADKLAKEKAEADALAKKKADEDAAARAKGDKEAADKLAKEKADADALAKKKAEEDAAAKAKADKELADKMAAQKSATDPLAMKNDVVKQDGIKANSGGSVLQVLGGETKYKDAVKKADGFFTAKKYKEAKRGYEEALTFKGGDPYAKGRLIECEKLINADDNQKTDERIKQLLAKYGPGVTEETISGANVTIIQRVVVKEQMGWIYQKKIYNWGGVAYFKDNAPITESTFEQDTQP